MSLWSDEPMQPRLDFLVNQDTWKACEAIRQPADRWRVYRHQLSWNSLQLWFQEMTERSVQLSPTAAAEPLKTKVPDDGTKVLNDGLFNTEPFDIWQVVEGVALKLGDRRVVVMPSEALDTAELRVPQEWVDVPNWASDYFVAARIDVDTQKLVLWGYATHEQLKEKGVYDDSDRTYCLAEAHIIQDFSTFWVAQDYPQPSPVVASTLLADSPALSLVQTENLLQRLAQAAEPRLVLPFAQWTALLSDRSWRRRFYQQRQQHSEWRGLTLLSNWLTAVTQSAVKSAAARSGSPPPYWQPLSQILPTATGTNVRDTASLITPEAGASLGTLIELKAADGTIIHLVLAVSVVPEADGRRYIRIQLHPASAEANSTLPENVSLSMQMTQTQEQLQLVRARAHDSYIQLPPFWTMPDRAFTVAVSQGDAAVSTDFVS